MKKLQWRFWGIAILSVILDRLSKVWIMQTFLLEQTRPLVKGIFHITYITNTGAAFSLFTQGAGWLRWLSLLVSLGLMAIAIWGPPMSRWEQMGYGFILGGAIGNGIDRFVFGHVVDFLDFRLINFPVFNIADVSINLGIACLLIAAFQPRKPLPYVKK
jgi:signal peptidase II